MTTDIDINITDMVGYTFTIKLNWDVDIMRQDIASHYEQKLLNEYLIKMKSTKKETLRDCKLRGQWFKSEEYKPIINIIVRLLI